MFETNKGDRYMAGKRKLVLDPAWCKGCGICVAFCPKNALELAGEKGIKSVAFCCISTGEFRFPNREAAEIAVDTVRRYRGGTEVIFNVFKDVDARIYRELLG